MTCFNDALADPDAKLAAAILAAPTSTTSGGPLLTTVVRWAQPTTKTNVPQVYARDQLRIAADFNGALSECPADSASVACAGWPAKEGPS